MSSGSAMLERSATATKPWRATVTARVVGDGDGAVVGDGDGAVVGEFDGPVVGELDGDGAVAGEFDGPVVGELDGPVVAELDGEVAAPGEPDGDGDEPVAADDFGEAVGVPAEHATAARAMVARAIVRAVDTASNS